jgi:integrase
MGMTLKQFEKIISVPHDEPRRYPAGDCLYFRVGMSGAVSFLMRYEVAGREKWHGIGPLKVFTLTEAREQVRKKRQLLREGIDPIEARRAGRAVQFTESAKQITFEEAAKGCFEAKKAQWSSEKNKAQFTSSLRQHAFPVLAKMPVAAIGTPDVLRVLEPMWASRTETARRVRARIKDVLDWAKTRGYRTGDNPAAWAGHLDTVLPKRSKTAVPHHPALDYRDASEFMAKLRAREGVNARALEFLVLAASRTGEVLGARWEDFDLQEKIWIVPAARMKQRKVHKVPLVPRAVEILQSLPREEGDFVFIGSRRGRPLDKMTLPTLLKAMGYDSITVHGMRATFRTWAGEMTNVPREICEAALAHYVGGTEGAYARGELLAKRTKLMQTWAAFCYSPLRRVDNVTPIGRRTASQA